MHCECGEGRSGKHCELAVVENRAGSSLPAVSSANRTRLRVELEHPASTSLNQLRHFWRNIRNLSLVSLTTNREQVDYPYGHIFKTLVE